MIDPCSRPKGLENLALHVDVGRDVSARRRDARVAQVVADYADVDAGLEQSDGTAMAEHVRRDATPTERRPFLRGETDVPLDDVCRAIARQRTASGVPEDWAIVAELERELA